VGKKSTKTKSTSTPWGPAQPYLLGAAQTMTNTVNQNQPNLQNLDSNLVGQLPALGSMAMGPQPGVADATNYLTDTLNGKYLNSNPYVQQQAALAGNDAANHVNATFSAAGRTGSGDHAYSLGKGITAAELPILSQEYQNERSLQNNAAGLLPGIDAARYAGVSPYLAATQEAGQLPYYGVGSLSGLGNLFGGYGTQTQTQPGGWMGGLLGAASNMFSFSPIKL
jgi:hypothetical protein